jgi:hypothetical protein
LVKNILSSVYIIGCINREEKIVYEILFDIPIYRLHKEQYDKEMSVYVEISMYPGPSSHNEELKQFYEKLIPNEN